MMVVLGTILLGFVLRIIFTFRHESIIKSNKTEGMKLYSSEIDKSKIVILCLTALSIAVAFKVEIWDGETILKFFIIAAGIVGEFQKIYSLKWMTSEQIYFNHKVFKRSELKIKKKKIRTEFELQYTIETGSLKSYDIIIRKSDEGAFENYDQERPES